MFTVFEQRLYSNVSGAPFSFLPAPTPDQMGDRFVGFLLLLLHSHWGMIVADDVFAMEFYLRLRSGVRICGHRWAALARHPSSSFVGCLDFLAVLLLFHKTAFSTEDPGHDDAQSVDPTRTRDRNHKSKPESSKPNQLRFSGPIAGPIGRPVGRPIGRQMLHQCSISVP